MTNREVAVYVGSFDPLHNGHVEAVSIAQKMVGRVVLLPNNPRKGKPERKSLKFRLHCMGKVYPLVSSNDWIIDNDILDSIVVDSRDCDVVLDEIRKQGFKVVGLIGSDVVTTKWKADRWIVVERQGYPLSLRGKNDAETLIPISQTAFQHLSSTEIKKNKLYNDVPRLIAPYLDKHCDTLSENMINIRFLETTVEKTFRSVEIAKDVAKKSQIINAERASTPFLIAEFLHVDETTCTVVEKRFQDCETLATLLADGKQEEELQQFCTLLEEHYKTTTFLHGDMSVANVLVLRNVEKDAKRFALIDYERVALLNPEKNRESQFVKEKSKFYSSIGYYRLLSGK